MSTYLQFCILEFPAQVLREKSTREAYDKAVQHSRLLPDVPVWDKVDILELEPSEEEGYLMYPCKCGGEYLVSLQDLQNCDRLITPCSTCSLNLEVSQSTKRTA